MAAVPPHDEMQVVDDSVGAKVTLAMGCLFVCLEEATNLQKSKSNRMIMASSLHSGPGKPWKGPVKYSISTIGAPIWVYV